MAEGFSAMVVRSTGSWYEVLHEGERLQCRIRGKLRLKGVRSTNPVVVGDVVRVEADAEGAYVISAIEPRRNYIDLEGRAPIEMSLQQPATGSSGATSDGETSWAWPELPQKVEDAALSYVTHFCPVYDQKQGKELTKRNFTL